MRRLSEQVLAQVRNATVRKSAINQKGDVMNSRIAVIFFVAVTVGSLSVGSALGQGGTGREIPKTPTKTAPTGEKTTPAKRNTPTSRQSACTAQSPAQASGRTHSMGLGSGISLDLVGIPAGSFCMGSAKRHDNERPVHQVTINYTFYMGKYEVTQAQWQAVMGNNPSNFKDCGGDCPVEQVSWNDAQDFIRKLNRMNDDYTYRLPSEAEWEYACRAGTTDDHAGDLKEIGWFAENSDRRTHAVGQKKPNAWDLADLQGNVLEWCEDWYHATYQGAPMDGSAWLSGGEQKDRVLRGGFWGERAVEYQSTGRNANYFSSPDFRNNSTGFRVVAVARAQ